MKTMCTSINASIVVFCSVLSFFSFSQNQHSAEGVEVTLNLIEKGDVEAKFKFPEFSDENKWFKFTVVSFGEDADVVSPESNTPHFYGQIRHTEPSLKNAFTVGLSKDMTEPLTLIFDTEKEFNKEKSKHFYVLDLAFIRSFDVINSDTLLKDRFLPVNKIILNNTDDFESVEVKFAKADDVLQTIVGSKVAIPNDVNGRYRVIITPKNSSPLSTLAQVLVKNIAVLLISFGCFAGVATITKGSRAEFPAKLLMFGISTLTGALNIILYMSFGDFLVFIQTETASIIVFITATVSAFYFNKIDKIVVQLRQALQA